jgi:hypothetical protein
MLAVSRRKKKMSTTKTKLTIGLKNGAAVESIVERNVQQVTDAWNASADDEWFGFSGSDRSSARVRVSDISFVIIRAVEEQSDLVKPILMPQLDPRKMRQ